MASMRETIPASTRSLPHVLAVTLVVGVVVGVAWGRLGAPALAFGALYLVAVALFLVPGSRQVTVTDRVGVVRPAAKARAVALFTHLGGRLDQHGPLFTWWMVADRRYCTPTPRAEPLFALVDAPDAPGTAGDPGAPDEG